MPLSTSPEKQTERRLTMVEALREALREEMRRDDRVILLGEDIGVPGGFGGAFTVTLGLEQEFGHERVLDTPISEAAIAGVAAGAAMGGLIPVADVQYGDFLFLAMDQLANQAAKMRYMSGGKITVPMVFRAPVGATTRGAQHGQSLEAFLMHVPGLKVACPSNPYDGKGMMHAAIRDPDPVLFLWPDALREHMQEVPDEPYTVPLGKAAVRTQGSDITIVGSGGGMDVVMEATQKLQAKGMKVEAIDLRSIKPMDTETLVNSVKKTKYLLTVDQSYYTLGLGAEVIARVAENVDGARYKRVAFPDAPPPASPEMFLWMRPNADHVAAAAMKLIG
jgi:pyruvate dehydrogenase E1 component beta subunit